MITAQTRAATLIPANGSVSIDLTEEVANAVAERLDDFDRDHDAHHAEQIAAEMLERLQHDELGLPHDHETVRREL